MVLGGAGQGRQPTGSSCPQATGARAETEAQSRPSVHAAAAGWGPLGELWSWDPQEGHPATWRWKDAGAGQVCEGESPVAPACLMGRPPAQRVPWPTQAHGHGQARASSCSGGHHCLNPFCSEPGTTKAQALRGAQTSWVPPCPPQSRSPPGGSAERTGQHAAVGTPTSREGPSGPRGDTADRLLLLGRSLQDHRPTSPHAELDFPKILQRPLTHLRTHEKAEDPPRCHKCSHQTRWRLLRRSG